MNSRLAVLAGLVCGMAMLVPGRLALAQSNMPATKVAVCDPLKVLGQILEGKDASGRWKAEGDTLQQQASQKQEQLKSEEESVKLIMPGSPDYDQRMEKLTQDEADAQAWVAATKANFARKQRAEQKELFKKIQDAIKQVAAQQGINLVLNGAQPEFPDLERMDGNVYLQTIMAHICLFADDHLDITSDVVIALDKAYKAGGAAGAAPAGGAPAGGAPAGGAPAGGTPAK
jgi:Skp family chaperone for outer membrane proteins